VLPNDQAPIHIRGAVWFSNGRGAIPYHGLVALPTDRRHNHNDCRYLSNLLLPIPHSEPGAQGVLSQLPLGVAGGFLHKSVHRQASLFHKNQ
jgi:hypothetical protein